jgi:peptidoglycan/xylan/chitin deacetylase (PgdA/CDA1 family)
MIARRLAALLLASSTACAAVTGCAFDDEPFDEGDGVLEDEVVSERQLFGNELPPKTLSLTYDDGPGERTAELAEYLASRGIPATFFINGDKVPGKQRHIDAIISRGHLLANHTHHHRQLTSLSSANVVSDVTRTDDIIAEAQPEGPWLIRAPFGAWNASVARTINASPMRKYVGSVFWDVGGQLTATAGADWACWGRNGKSVEECGDLYLNEIRTKGRGIVLLHDIHGKTVDMTKYLVPLLEAEGYRFVQLDAVPSVRRGINAVASGATENATDGGCMSATLGRAVAEKTCVQSRNDRNWHRCVRGEWTRASGQTDARCTETFPLP